MMRPAKPRPDFPLYAHACGRWAKRINNRTVYFGLWDDWRGSLDQYLKEKDAWEHGINPRGIKPETLTVAELCDEFYESKRAAHASGELAKRTLDEYERSCTQLVTAFGKNRAVADLRPSDFRALRLRLADGRSVVTLKNEIQRVRVVFRYGEDTLEAPRTKYGQEFKRPPKRTMRLDRAARGKRSFEADEIHALLAVANVQMKAMILLGINCGFGPGDCGRLERRHLAGGWVEYSRPKTGIGRRAKLWPETVAAIRAALEQRRTPKDNGDWVFVTQLGNPWSKPDSTASPVSEAMAKLLPRAGLAPGRNFYALRHAFRHAADSCGDQPAVAVVMGHTDNSIAADYRGEVDDDRLAAVADHVHKWLFG